MNNYYRGVPAGGRCPYECKSKETSGYCKFTACINPRHNGSGVWYIQTCSKCLHLWYSREKASTCPQCGYRGAEDK